MKHVKQTYCFLSSLLPPPNKPPPRGIPKRAAFADAPEIIVPRVANEAAVEDAANDETPASKSSGAILDFINMNSMVMAAAASI
jgi:hypothetical protein